MGKADSTYQIGDWTLHPRLGMARRRDENVHLEPRAAELLLYLAMRPGEVIPRAELLDAIWPNLVVGDEVVTNAVAKLRRAFGDDPRSPRFIETIPKRGYRMLAPVHPPKAPAPTAPRRWWLLPAAAVVAVTAVLMVSDWFPGRGPDGVPPRPLLALPDKPSIVVLPFVNLSDDAGQAFFADGLTEDLITDLSRVSGLFVIARNSSFLYKGKPVDVRAVGRELGVRFIVEGSVRRVGPDLRINVQLIDAETGGHLWASRYDGDADQVLAFQDEIAQALVSELSVEMTGSEKDQAAFQDTFKPSAYEAFLQGWAAYRRETPEDFSAAIGHLERAIAEDSAYGRAYAALAAVYWETYRKRWHRRLGISPLPRVWQRADEYLDKSMVAPTPLAYTVASSMLTTNRRFDQAIAEARRAIASDPNDPLGYVALAEALIFTGAPTEAEQLVRKAIRLDPRDPGPYLVVLGKAQLVAGAAADALPALEQATARVPDDRIAWMALISAYGTLGESAQAGSALEALNELQRRDKLVSFTLARAREHWPFARSEAGSRFFDGLRQAGVPEW